MSVVDSLKMQVYTKFMFSRSANLGCSRDPFHTLPNEASSTRVINKNDFLCLYAAGLYGLY